MDGSFVVAAAAASCLRFFHLLVSFWTKFPDFSKFRFVLKPQVFDCHIHCVYKTTAMTMNDEGGVIQY